MKGFLWRLIKLFFGLIYRLIVLVLFEKWIPFSQPSAAEQERKTGKARPQRPPRPPKSAQKRQRKPERVRGRRPSYHEGEFFDAYSIEPSAEEVQRMEGQHWVRRKKAAPVPAAAASAERPLRELVRDKRALREALVLSAALSPPRSLPRR